MKKFFLMAFAATAMLVSCSLDETVETAGSKAIIGFADAFVDNATRSVSDPSLTVTTLGSFDVYGFTQAGQIFDGVTVSSGDQGATWTYSPLQYWVAGNNYAFAAIAPAGTTVSEESMLGSSVADYKVGMTVAFTNDGKTDLLYAGPAAIKADETFVASPSPVALTFKHQLSKVKFSFVNTVGDAYTIKVSDVKITDAKSTGTLTVAAEGNTWAVGGETLELAFGAAGAAETTADEIAYNAEGETYNELLMIPTASTVSYNVTFTVELLNGSTSMASYDHAVTVSGVELKLGYCYDFKATFTAENISPDPDSQLKPIEFTVTEISAWDETESDQTLIAAE